MGKQESGCCKKATYFVRDARPSMSGHFYVDQEPECCKGGNSCTNCDEGLLKGNLCMYNSMPIYDQDKKQVASLKQLVPLVPTGPCCAAQGPTLQISVHGEPGVELTEEQKTQLALF